MKNLIILFGLLISSLQVVGQSADDGKIDIEYKQCLDDSTTTDGMRRCAAVAMQKWDSELNKYYKLLMENISTERQAMLREAQREWIQYRDKEFAFINGYYFEEKQGTMWYPVADGEKMKMVKRRALELKDFYETLED